MQRYLLKCCLMFLLLSAGFTKLSAQITANPSSGCAPLVGVQFTGLSGASSIQWAFGDGTFSNINNPVHTYSNPATYTVTYNAIVSGSAVTQTITVNVFGKPSPSFTYSPSPASGCAPVTINFTDQSTGSGSASIPVASACAV